MVRDRPLSGGLNHARNQAKMAIHLFTAGHQNLIQRHARCLAPSTSVDLLLVDRHANRHLGVQNPGGLISICTWFYHRMAFPAFVIRRVLESNRLLKNQ